MGRRAGAVIACGLLLVYRITNIFVSAAGIITNWRSLQYGCYNICGVLSPVRTAPYMQQVPKLPSQGYTRGICPAAKAPNNVLSLKGNKHPKKTGHRLNRCTTTRQSLIENSCPAAAPTNNTQPHMTYQCCQCERLSKFVLSMHPTHAIAARSFSNLYVRIWAPATHAAGAQHHWVLLPTPPPSTQTNSTPACMPKQLLTRPHKVLSAAAAYIWVAQRASQADAVPGCLT